MKSEHPYFLIGLSISTILGLALGFSTSVLAATVSPSSGVCTEMTYSIDDPDNNSARIYNADTEEFIADWNGDVIEEPLCPNFDGGTLDLPDGNYVLNECSGTCDFDTFTTQEPFTITSGSEETGFTGLITSAIGDFASTTGFSMGSVVAWAGDSLVKVFLGAMIAVLFELRYWIVALIIISLVIYFAYRSLRPKI